MRRFCLGCCQLANVLCLSCPFIGCMGFSPSLYITNDDCNKFLILENRVCAFMLTLWRKLLYIFILHCFTQVIIARPRLEEKSTVI